MFGATRYQGALGYRKRFSSTNRREKKKKKTDSKLSKNFTEDPQKKAESTCRRTLKIAKALR